MPVTRMRMRPWLECTLDSQTIDGLKWIDKDKKLFSIPWKHAARHGWQVEKDACLFKLWAIHTGKFRADAPPDPKTWKANFRCALNSLPDIEEVKTRSINKGCSAVRVYQMLPEMPRKKNKRSRSRDGKRKTKNSLNIKRKRESSSTEEESLTQESTVDSTEDMEETVGCQVSYLSDHEVPEISTSVEIGPDSTSPWSFQVSPAYQSTEYDDDLIRLSQQLEREDAQWSASDIDGKGFLINELGSLTDNIVRAKSRWHDDTSDIPDEIELHVVTELLEEWNQYAQRQNEETYSWDWTTTCVTFPKSES